MPNYRLQDTAGEVTVSQGQILLDGPDGVAVAMTPEAARITGERLIAGAERASREEAGDAPVTQ